MVLDSSDTLCLPRTFHQSFHCRPTSKIAGCCSFFPVFSSSYYTIIKLNWFLFFCLLDGEHGALSGGVRCNALRHNHNVQPINGCCSCNLRSEISSSPSSRLDRHSQAPHRLFRISAHVSVCKIKDPFPFFSLFIKLIDLFTMMMKTGIVRSYWRFSSGNSSSSSNKKGVRVVRREPYERSTPRRKGSLLL